MNKLIIYIIDAARPDYINPTDTPFLHRIKANHGLTVLRPSFGFCERTEIMTGTKPLENGFFTAIGFDPSSSGYRKYKYLNAFFGVFDGVDKIIFGGLVRKVARRIYRRLGVGFDCYQIPFKYLSYLSLTEDSSAGIRFMKNAPNSLYKLCKKKGLKVNDSSFTSLGKADLKNDLARIDNLKHQLSNGNEDVYLVYISHCDSNAHYKGPESTNFRKSLSVLDQHLSDFYSWATTKLSENVKSIYIGDHGMREVINRFDITSAFHDFESIHKDRIEAIFVDSTVCRFWFKDKEVKLAFMNWAMGHREFTDFGVFYSCEDYEKLGVPNVSRRYGDLMWVANSGVLIEPCYFNPEKGVLNGMHGYIPKDNKDFGFITGDCGSYKSDIQDLVTANKIILRAINDIF